MDLVLDLVDSELSSAGRCVGNSHPQTVSNDTQRAGEYATELVIVCLHSLLSCNWWATYVY